MPNNLSSMVVNVSNTYEPSHTKFYHAVINSRDKLETTYLLHKRHHIYHTFPQVICWGTFRGDREHVHPLQRGIYNIGMN